MKIDDRIGSAAGVERPEVVSWPRLVFATIVSLFLARIFGVVLAAAGWTPVLRSAWEAEGGIPQTVGLHAALAVAAAFIAGTNPFLFGPLVALAPVTASLVFTDPGLDFVSPALIPLLGAMTGSVIAFLLPIRHRVLPRFGAVLVLGIASVFVGVYFNSVRPGIHEAATEALSGSEVLALSSVDGSPLAFAVVGDSSIPRRLALVELRQGPFGSWHEDGTDLMVVDPPSGGILYGPPTYCDDVAVSWSVLRAPEVRFCLHDGMYAGVGPAGATHVEVTEPGEPPIVVPLSEGGGFIHPIVPIDHEDRLQHHGLSYEDRTRRLAFKSHDGRLIESLATPWAASSLVSELRQVDLIAENPASLNVFVMRRSEYRYVCGTTPPPGAWIWVVEHGPPTARRQIVVPEKQNRPVGPVLAVSQAIDKPLAEATCPRAA